MTILTPSPRVSSLHSPEAKSITMSTTNTKTMVPTSSTILWMLTPALTTSLQLATFIQLLLTQTTIFMLYHAHQALALLIKQRLAAFAMLKYVFSFGQTLTRIGWKKTEKARDKLFFEFMVFILGVGNGLFLVLFWPGWIVVGLTGWAAWMMVF